MKNNTLWKTIESPGYFGKKRNELINNWNQIYGKDNWRLAYQWGNIVVPREIGIQIYEDAYYEFFKKNLDILEWLTNTALDIYDTAETNTEAKFDYEHQETPRTHIHDISIRRSVLRLGKCFKGNRLIHVRWKDSEGFKINPGIVPFHLPEMIFQGEIKDHGESGLWWNPKSIEDFYQRNKLLQIKV